MNPTRIGMVFYQHTSLNYKDHGNLPHKAMGNAVEHSKYVRWLGRSFVPCSGELHTLKQVGYHFPDGVKVKPSKSDTVNFKPELESLETKSFRLKRNTASEIYYDVKHICKN